MRESRRLIGAVVLAAVCLTGCWESKAQGDAADLRQQIGLAQRLCDRAAALMATAVFTVDGKYPPFLAGQTPTSSQIDLLPAQAVNPNALEAIDKAKDLLSKAIADNPQSEPEDLALAKQTLARVLQLKGAYHAQQVAAARGGVSSAKVKVAGAARLLAAQADLLKFYDKTLQMTNSELAKVQQDVASQRQVAQAEMDAAAGRLVQLEPQARELDGKLRQIGDRAAALSRQAKEAAPDQGVQLYEQVEQFRKDADVVAIEFARKTVEIEDARQVRADAQLTVDQLTRQAEALGAVAQDRAKAAAVTAEYKAASEKSLADQRAALIAALDDLAGRLALVQEAQAKALDAYGQAASQLAAAQFAASPKTRSMAPSQKALVQTRLGELNVLQMRFEAPLASLVNQVKAAWERSGGKAPAALDKVKGQLADPNKLAAAASEAYEKAVNLYQQAANTAGPMAWAARGNLAIAYMALADLTSDKDKKAELVANAQEAAKDAIAGREASDFAMQLRQAMGLMLVESPTSGPALSTQAAAPAKGGPASRKQPAPK